MPPFVTLSEGSLIWEEPVPVTKRFFAALRMTVGCAQNDNGEKRALRATPVIGHAKQTGISWVKR